MNATQKEKALKKKAAVIATVVSHVAAQESRQGGQGLRVGSHETTQNRGGSSGGKTGQSNKGGAEGGGVMARLGNQPVKRGGPNNSGSGARTSGTSLKKWNAVFKPAAQDHVLEGVPLAHMFTTDSHAERLEPQEEAVKGGRILRGSEFLAQVVIPPAIGGATTTVPQGGAFFCMPLNPLKVDGLRVSRELSLEDQFRIRKMAIEYVPLCPMTQPGGFVGVITNDVSSNITQAGGQLTLRDALSRPGAELCSVIAPAVTRQNTQLLKWYYTQSEGGADLEVPGLFWLLSTMDQSNTTTSAVPLGILWMHYEFEVRSDSFELPATLNYSPQGGFSVAFQAVVQVIGDAVALPMANFPIPNTMRFSEVIFSFIVVSCDDSGQGGSTGWRTWHDYNAGKLVLIAPGAVVYGRTNELGTHVALYPSLAAAENGAFPGADEEVRENVGYGWSIASNMVGVAGLKVYALSGYNIARV